MENKDYNVVFIGGDGTNTFTISSAPAWITNIRISDNESRTGYIAFKCNEYTTAK